MGNVRKMELANCCSYLGVELVGVEDRIELKDGFQYKWDKELISKIVEEYVERFHIHQVISSLQPSEAVLLLCLRCYFLCLIND